MQHGVIGIIEPQGLCGCLSECKTHWTPICRLAGQVNKKNEVEILMIFFVHKSRHSLRMGNMKKNHAKSLIVQKILTYLHKLTNKFGHAKREMRPAVPRHAHHWSLRRRICVIVYLCPFCCHSSSRHSYHVDFGWTFVYVYVLNCVIVSFLLLRVIGIGRSFWPHVCLCMRARECVRTCARVCVCVRRCVFCNRLSSGFRYLRPLSSSAIFVI